MLKFNAGPATLDQLNVYMVLGPDWSAISMIHIGVVEVDLVWVME